MRYIDLEGWARRSQFEAFSHWEYPHFNLCANVDLTSFYPVVQTRAVSFTLAIVYVIARTANEIPEFHYRIRGDQVVEHETVHPAITVLLDDESFTFCALEYSTNFLEFAEKATKQMVCIKEHPTLHNDPDQDNLLYMTAIPWVSFTSITHPLDLSPADSVPRFAWGKYFKDGDTLQMPLSVQAHHALMDGLHAGRFFEKIQGFLNQPYLMLGEV